MWVSLDDYVPPPRYPPVLTPWTAARIRESLSASGPWQDVVTVALAPLDADPQEPIERRFSTGSVTLGAWVDVVWLDAEGSEAFTDPVFVGQLPGPTAQDVRAAVPPQFDWAAAGYPAPIAGQRDGLTGAVAHATAMLELTVGREFASFSSAERLVADKAVALLVLHDAMGGTRAALAVQSKPWLRSYTAGSYSQTRFSPAELAGANGSGKADVIAKLHPWRALALALWLLATPAKREEWIELYTGQVAPAGGVFVHDAGGGGEGLWPYGALWPS